jgi:hypothetical protein
VQVCRSLGVCEQLQTTSALDPKPWDNERQQKLIGWGNFVELISDLLSRFVGFGFYAHAAIAQTHFP